MKKAIIILAITRDKHGDRQSYTFNEFDPDQKDQAINLYKRIESKPVLWDDLYFAEIIKEGHNL